MEVVVLDSADAVAEYGAQRIIGLVKQNSAAVLGLATGRTPVALYKCLIRAYQQGVISFQDVTAFNLDEYVGIGEDDPLSFSAFMRRELFDAIDINLESTHIPKCPEGQNPFRVGEEYERSIELAGGIDLQLLGIGTNGHIGFNEPTSSLASRTRVKTLAGSTINDNSLNTNKAGVSAELAVTMGIGTILDTRRVLLLATGEGKAGAISAAVEGPVSSMCPASALQLHPTVTVVVDQAAASQLQLIDYYLHVHQQQAAVQTRFGQLAVDQALN
ncbi:MAG: glucosamine-6-phosphate deaminase [Woeseia sp.]